MAGSKALGCMAFAAKWDISIASMKEILAIVCAAGSIFGLAVNIPLTSVHIHTSSASRATPRMVAV